MSTGLLTNPVVLPILAVSGAASVLRAWIAHRTAIRLAAERTRRVALALALGGVQRRAAEVVLACAELEGAIGDGTPTTAGLRRARVRGTMTGAPSVGAGRMPVSTSHRARTSAGSATSRGGPPATTAPSRTAPSRRATSSSA